jgi:pyruvate/2-oxoglutarate dehydrogenase complex dihydrolipoamide dehydrogenase (E3) component
MEEFEAIIIGAGQAGVPLAKKLAGAGWQTALIERRAVGGTCINDGCTPTKTMVASARMAYLAGKSQEYGVEIPSFSVNFEQIMDRKNEVVKQFRGGAESGVEDTENLSLIYGDAIFTGSKTLCIKTEGGEKVLSANYIFINTGAAAIIPDIEGVKDIPYLTNTSVLELEVLPEHLLIVGAGYVSLEFGQMFRRFGSNVTIIEHGDRLLSKEDPDVCESISEILEQEDIQVLVNTQTRKFQKNEDGTITVTLDEGGTERTEICSHVLLATGRAPQTETLGLENTGVQCDDHGHIIVNEFLETDEPNVYALGDVKGGPAFTHISYNDFVVVSKNLLNGSKTSIKDRPVPYCMFTDPQLGRIGLSEEDAIKQGLNYLVAKLPMENVARAIENNEIRGFMKAIVDKETKQILGATIIGEQGGEIMTMLQLAMTGHITYEDIRYMIFAHPLYAESLNNLFTSIDE